jgi:hypothetical protein
MTQPFPDEEGRETGVRDFCLEEQDKWNTYTS